MIWAWLSFDHAEITANGNIVNLGLRGMDKMRGYENSSGGSSAVGFQLWAERISAVRDNLSTSQIGFSEKHFRMRTSPAALARLLDPCNASLALQRLSRAPEAVRRALRVEFV
jgi:hypothetical protein